MKRSTVLLMLSMAVTTTACNDPGNDLLDLFSEPRVYALFNAPGGRQQNQRDLEAEALLVETLDSAKESIDVCTYGFSNRDVYNAVVRAYLRGVDVRIAGDAKHFFGGESGYAEIQKHHIPLQVGNQWHIMHNKFFVVDKQVVFVGTGNITTTGFDRNNNNWVIINHPGVAAKYNNEFQQMFDGKFSTAKQRLNDPNTFQVGDTEVEVYFSPQDDAMGRILENVEAAESDIEFTIFAFTKDQIGSRFVTKHREFQEFNAAQGLSDLPPVTIDGAPMQPKKVAGVLDRSQVYGNYLYHEVYRMVGGGVPMRMDANENSRLPGDYQAGGGRLHSKTMMIDKFGAQPRVITGSFNWSSAATIANDETMLILHGQRITDEYYREFEKMWGGGKALDQAVCNYSEGYATTELPLCTKDVKPGDVVITEVYWDGYNGLIDPTDHTGSRDFLDNDEFFEIHNTTNQPIDLSLWTLTNGFDFKMGFTPGTVILPGQYFLVVDHNLETYSDSESQSGVQAFKNANFVVNIPNDPRMPRLNLPNSSMYLELVDASGRTIDAIGDSGAPFAGGRVIGTPTKGYSMERLKVNGVYAPGTARTSWQRCQLAQGGANVNDGFKEIVIASPGEANSN
ncbi:MAG: phospholipase D-like domain-containing protein [bacterium]